MSKASELVNSEDFDFDTVIKEIKQGSLKSIPKKAMKRAAYAHTRLEKELQDAKNRQRAVRRGDH